jgi:hypothetical protein
MVMYSCLHSIFYMIHGKLTARKHVHVSPRRNQEPSESYSDGQCASYFSRTLRKILRSLGYNEASLFIGTPPLLHRTTYIWNVRVVLYEKATTDHISCTRQVHGVVTPMTTPETGMWDATRQAMVVLCHEEEDPVEHTQCRHFRSD